MRPVPSNTEFRACAWYAYTRHTDDRRPYWKRAEYATITGEPVS
jgi:hypothetical protein